jgi:hypothetical protein
VLTGGIVIFLVQLHEHEFGNLRDMEDLAGSTVRCSANLAPFTLWGCAAQFFPFLLAQDSLADLDENLFSAPASS